MYRILICDRIEDVGIKLLEKEGFKVDVKLDISPEQLKEELRNYDAVIIKSRTVLNKEIIESAKDRLKVIARAGVGTDNIDVETATKLGIKVLTAAEVPAQSVAELTIGLMISLARKICLADRSMKEGGWLKSEMMGTLLKDKVLGIIGFGRIGKLVAKIAKSIGMKLLISDPHPDMKLVEELGGKVVSLEELLQSSDFVSLHVPLTPETYHMINEGRLRLMKKDAFLINTSRGEVVDEKSLFKALKEGWIAGAAMDVYEVEPPLNDQLIKLPNTVCTPHIGSQTKETQVEISEVISRKIIRELRQNEHK